MGYTPRRRPPRNPPRPPSVARALRLAADPSLSLPELEAALVELGRQSGSAAREAAGFYGATIAAAHGRRHDRGDLRSRLVELLMADLQRSPQTPPCRECVTAAVAYGDADRVAWDQPQCPHGVRSKIGEAKRRHARRVTAGQPSPDRPVPVPVCPTCAADIVDGRCPNPWCQLTGKLIPVPATRAPGRAGRFELDAAIAHLAGLPATAPAEVAERRFPWVRYARDTVLVAGGLAIAAVAAVTGEVEPATAACAAALAGLPVVLRAIDHRTDDPPTLVPFPRGQGRDPGQRRPNPSTPERH